MVDFWNVYRKSRATEGFSKSRLYLSARDRIHASLSSVERSALTLDMSKGLALKYDESTRYLIAKDLTYDMLVSIYDVNSSFSVVFRESTILDDSEIARIRRQVAKAGKSNLELRAIGLQNNYSALINSLEDLCKVMKFNLQEIDVFGSGVRHIVFDTKVGMAFDLLPQNRVIGPNDLVNRLSIDDFNKARSELTFI
ncbi:Uncharacterised protein [uncultured archaeon]|nr:Uncharacterised protein [uncultured archaeon]